MRINFYDKNFKYKIKIIIKNLNINILFLIYK